MKQFAKIIAFCIVISFILTPVTHANNITTHTYTFDNVEIEITHSGLSEEKLLQVAQTLVSENVNSNTQTYGLTCTLFGHKLVATTNEVTTHMVYDTYPHCERKTYESNVCERCDYMETTLISTDRVGCCVE